MIEAGDEAARLAFDVYCYRIRKYVGAYTGRRLRRVAQQLAPWVEERILAEALQRIGQRVVTRVQRREPGDAFW